MANRSSFRLLSLKNYLESSVRRFENDAFIANDPIAIPHAYENRRDQEIIALYAALLAWGRRKTILKKMEELCKIMSYRPYQFVHNFQLDTDAEKLNSFVHRTFQSSDAIWLTNNISLILRKYGSLENAFNSFLTSDSDLLENAIEGFSNILFTIDPRTPLRLRKHLARPSSGSACKRFCMYLRWMIRTGSVDLGIWSCVSKSQLILPLDVHSSKQARALGMLNRNKNDWKAALELTKNCQFLSPEDPCRYDYAFFGLGVSDIPLDYALTGENRLNVTSLRNSSA